MKFTSALFLAGLVSLSGVASAGAQDAPPPAPPPAAAEATCGGLLCDLGVFHASSAHRIDEGLPCGVICRAFGGTPAEPPPPPAPEPIAAPASSPASVPTRHARRKHMKAARAAASVETPAKPN